jgi:outer membrane protein OmpA-like peptidoglycan-associated protein
MRSILRGSTFTAALVALLLVQPSAARGDGAETGGYLGAGFPVGHYSDTADIGGVLGAWGGYRWTLSEKGAFSLIGGPQYTLLPSESCPAGPTFVRCDDGDDVTSTFSFTAGPKFTILSDGTELSIALLGGYYRDVSGPLDESGGGLAVHGLLGRDIGAGMNLGLFVRFEEMFLRPAADSDRDDRQMVMAGLQLGWTFAPEPVEAAPPPPPPPPPAPVVKRRIILRGVNFDFDKSNIRPDARPILDEAIRTLKEEPAIRVRIEGHTDSVGTEQYNQRLSQRRAQAVKEYLVRGGIAASRLESVGMGESDPVASNDTADGRAQNRRAELEVLN